MTRARRSLVPGAATIVGDKDANPGDGKITGTDGNDIITGGDGFDRVNGGPGQDTCEQVSCEKTPNPNPAQHP